MELVLGVWMGRKMIVVGRRGGRRRRIEIWRSDKLKEWKRKNLGVGRKVLVCMGILKCIEGVEEVMDKGKWWMRNRRIDYVLMVGVLDGMIGSGVGVRVVRKVLCVWRVIV